jgi:anti-sigma B factor antagonist
MTTTTRSAPSQRPRTGPVPATGRPTAAPRPVPTSVDADAAPGPTAPATLTVTVEHTDRGTCLHLDGELEATTAPLLDCLVADALERRGEVLVDLSRTTFCDVRGLDCLLAARRRAQAPGRRLSLLGTPPLLRDLLTLTGAADLIGPEG